MLPQSLSHQVTPRLILQQKGNQRLTWVSDRVCVMHVLLFLINNILTRVKIETS